MTSNPPTLALNFRRRRVQHKWTQEERMLLCCMKRFFDLSNRDITKIFNSLYETKIRNEGFSDGLPRSTVNTQWEDLRRKRHLDFNLVHREPGSSVSAVPESTENSQSSDVPEPITRIRSYALKNEIQPPTRPSNVPGLLWRFSNDDSMGINHRSGYIAGAFINDIGNIPSPEERAAEFPTWLECHVRPRRIPSPFISSSMDPLVPIHRALTRGKNAFDLMKQYQIYTPGYRGVKEYIIWGAIGRGAIVMSFRADHLITIANEHPDIKNALQLELISVSPNCKSQLYKKIATKEFENDLSIGKVIGKFLRLLHLQQEYVEDVALALNSSWSFTSSETNTDFLRGARQAYQEIASPLQSQTSASQSQSSPDRRPSNIDLGDQDTHDYVIVDRPQADRTIQDQQLRQSIDRLSIHDNEELPIQNYSRVIAARSPSVAARTVATRRISLFDQESESWVVIPEAQPSIRGRDLILPSIENGTPPCEQTDAQPPSSQQPTFETPTSSPKIKRSRSESTDSESTLSPSTPARQFSRERSHVDRVLGIDWASFWDSMQNHA
ncbi:hypothetical protein UA08_08187 [Talaromyces atroroseus]|uniref:DUF7587 domain-containing protein n=1 Tax=Talaromyces atroroseus TaxID=1441469 RepID=A0A225APS3_TALAT|nr:hypothetical protein UA08_08187 [Talaromyces atroroseus]OKL56425.1 hypothetical protein UA08_08187 [Talaromyces atroroseus]